MRTCGTMDVHQRLWEGDQEYRDRRAASEARALEYERGGLARLREEVTEIPVVVHVVHHPNHPRTNISDQQIQSQIEALNRDFRRANADVGSIPSAFRPQAFDTRIQFRLADKDPAGNPTHGITRTGSDKPYFKTVDRDVMSTTTGGADAWPADRYLNIWVCGRLVGEDGVTTQMGYATLPGVSDGKDGVVIAHWAFGTTGTAEEPYDLGRTTVHEVGHWLNLHHIWGEKEDCGPSDDHVADTPKQEGPNYEFPTFPHVSCSNDPHGDMFMDYMDYTDDACMRIFTPGQALRMHAALDSDRPGI